MKNSFYKSFVRDGAHVIPLDHHAYHLASLETYRRRRVPRHPHMWDRIRDGFERAYSRGDLSDNEHDDLLNRWVEAVHGSATATGRPR